MRIEDTARLCDQVEQSIRREIPAGEYRASSTTSACRTAASISRTAIRPRSAPPMQTFWSRFRRTSTDGRLCSRSFGERCRSEFPGVMFAFLPADIVSQILNFGLPAPIDVQVVGRRPGGQPRYAPTSCCRQIRYVPGTADLRIQQPSTSPICTSRSNGPRPSSSASLRATSHKTSWSRSAAAFRPSPTFWLDPNNGVSYQIATQTPQYRADTLQDLVNIPVTGTNPHRRLRHSWRAWCRCSAVREWRSCRTTTSRR